MMLIDSHAVTRAAERLQGVVPNALQLITRAAEYAAKRPTTPQAILVARLGGMKGDAQGNIMARASNGDQVWVIVRDGAIRTVMFRRSSQPRHPGAFNVQHVADITATPTPAPVSALDQAIAALRQRVA